MGALSINGIAALRAPFEPLVPDVVHVRNTNRYHRPPARRRRSSRRSCSRTSSAAIEQAGPETVAMVIMEPVQNAGGSFTPPAGYWAGRPRDLRRVRGPALRRRGDHRLRAARRLVRLRAVRHPARHRHLREGALVGLRVDRRGDRPRRGHGAVPRGDADVHARDHLRRPSGAGGDRAQEHRDHEARADRRARRGRRRTRSASTLAQLLDLPIVGDLRGTGFFYALELVKDKETRETFTDEECEELLRGFLSRRLFERGLICRADDRGDPVIQISPPLSRRRRSSTRSTGILGDVLGGGVGPPAGRPLGRRALRRDRPSRRSRRSEPAPRRSSSDLGGRMAACGSRRRSTTRCAPRRSSRSPATGPVKGERIAQAQGIPLKFLENILLELRHARPRAEPARRRRRLLARPPAGRRSRSPR